MAARTDRQIHIGFRDAQLLKENVGHIDVVVLTGVDESLGNVRAASFRALQNGATFMKLGRAPTM